MIHYHGLPLTPAMDMLGAFRAKHAMVSFADSRQIAEACEVCQSVVLDNGAFTAWRSGEEFDYDGYDQWATTWLKHPAVEWAVIPDVIDGTEDKNDELIRAWGLPAAVSVPVFHLHESLSRLESLIARFPRVALGSSGEFSAPGSDNWWRRVAQVLDVACDEDGMPRVKLHGLRMLDPVIFSHIPLSSSDSCNVARNVGLDDNWKGPYAPSSRRVRAIIMMDRIEHHASARRWCRASSGVQQNFELIG